MGPKPGGDAADKDLLWTKLLYLASLQHGLVKLAPLIDWQAFAQAWGPNGESISGSPPWTRG